MIAFLASYGFWAIRFHTVGVQVHAPPQSTPQSWTMGLVPPLLGFGALGDQVIMLILKDASSLRTK